MVGALSGGRDVANDQPGGAQLAALEADDDHQVDVLPSSLCCGTGGELHGRGWIPKQPGRSVTDQVVPGRNVVVGDVLGT